MGWNELDVLSLNCQFAVIQKSVQPWKGKKDILETLGKYKYMFRRQLVY